MIRRVLVFVGALVALVHCGEDPVETGAPGSSGTTATSTSSGATSSSIATTSSGGAGGGGGGDPIRPPQVPEGWEKIADQPCPYWYAPDDAHMPPGPTWVPCPPFGQEMDCRMIAVEWPNGDDFPVGFYPRLWVDSNDMPHLLWTRRSVANDADADFSDYVVGPPDGKPDFALRFADPVGSECGLAPNSFNDGHFSFHAFGDGQDLDSNRDAGIVGKVGDPKPLLFYEDDTELTYSLYPAPEFVVQNSGAQYRIDWRTREAILIHAGSTDPDGLAASFVADMVGGVVLLNVGNLTQQGVVIYDDVGGTRPLVRWIGDATQGAANAGTDGVDLVWSEGHGKAPNESDYPERSIMTAPFTKEADQLVPRRLRSEPSAAFGGFQSVYRVGCGYAAHSVSGKNVIIVRLADGVSWLLENGEDYYFSTPAGITCEEIFIEGAAAGKTNILRIRLDSLGPGIAPD